MNWRCYLFLVVFLALEGSKGGCVKGSVEKRGRFGGESKESRIKSLELKTEETTSEVRALTNTLKQIKAAITLGKSECQNELKVLDQQIAEFEKVVTGNEIATNEMYKKVQQETDIQIELEMELQRVSILLGLGEYQYSLVNSELQFKSTRRENGTTKDCYDDKAALAEGAEDDLVVRARAARKNNFRKNMRSHKKTDEDLQSAEYALKIEEMIKLQLQKNVELAASNQATSSNVCKTEKAKRLDLLETLKDNNNKTVERLEALRSVYIRFKEGSDSARLNIRYGKQLLARLSKEIDRMRQNMEGYRTDEECFEYFHQLV